VGTAVCFRRTVWEGSLGGYEEGLLLEEMGEGVGRGAVLHESVLLILLTFLYTNVELLRITPEGSSWLGGQCHMQVFHERLR
jgi:hypothetical protein